jgi:uncharacterized protein YcfL
MMTRGLLLSLALIVAPGLGCSHESAPRPAPTEGAQASVVAVGATAPEAQLVGTTGEKVALADLLHQRAQTVVVFYRGFW